MPIPLIYMGGSALIGYVGGFFSGSSFTVFIKWLSVLATILASAYYFLIYRGK